MNKLVADYYSSCLEHHGIKAQKWGIRRHNKDGTIDKLW